MLLAVAGMAGINNALNGLNLLPHQGQQGQPGGPMQQPGPPNEVNQSWMSNPQSDNMMFYQNSGSNSMERPWGDSR